MKRKKKRISVLRLILLIIGIILLTAVILVIALGASLLIRFHNSAYEYEPPVEREDEYIMPDYPEVIIDPNAQWMADDTQQETLPPETVPVTVPDTAPETVPETVPETAESVPETAEPEEIVPETEEPAERAETAEVEETENDGLTEQVPNSDPDETQKPETQAPAETPKASQTVYIPPETLPNVVNPAPATSAPETKPAETIAYNRDASFSNSANTVSVYAGVPIYKVNQKNSDIVNILVMGTDSRDVTLDRGRSDAMIVVSYNSKTGSVKLTSLLRDSLVPIEGVGWNRINTAYFFGGVGLAVNTVNQLYNLDIQQFMVIDLNGVVDFIDYIGGVELTFTQEEAAYYTEVYGRTIEAGTQLCSSNMALRHMRNRSIGSDFERTRRQRDVIVALVDKILNEKSTTEIYDIADYMFSLIKTNISAKDLLAYATSILGNASKLSIDNQNVPYSDAYQYARYNGMSIISYDIAKAASRIQKFIYG